MLNTAPLQTRQLSACSFHVFLPALIHLYIRLKHVLHHFIISKWCISAILLKAIGEKLNILTWMEKISLNTFVLWVKSQYCVLNVSFLGEIKVPRISIRIWKKQTSTSFISSYSIFLSCLPRERGLEIIHYLFFLKSSQISTNFISTLALHQTWAWCG